MCKLKRVHKLKGYEVLGFYLKVVIYYDMLISKVIINERNKLWSHQLILMKIKKYLGNKKQKHAAYRKDRKYGLDWKKGNT